MLVPFTLQLLRECKDVLQGAVIVKQYYQYMVYAVFAEEEIMDLEQFDQDLRKMLDVSLLFSNVGRLVLGHFKPILIIF